MNYKVIRKCKNCGKEFETYHEQNKFDQIYCSVYCRPSYQKKIYDERKCKYCGKLFIPSHLNQIYCSNYCRQKFYREKIKIKKNEIENNDKNIIRKLTNHIKNITTHEIIYAGNGRTRPNIEQTNGLSTINFNNRYSHKERVLYGSVNLFRFYCENCGNPILSKTGYYFCDICGYEKQEYNYDLRKTETQGIERYLCPIQIKKYLNDKQKNRCFWCGREFGTVYSKIRSYGRKIIVSKLRRHYDHALPYSYLKSNPNGNWVLSCNICNHFKSNLIFQSDKDCRIYLNQKWKKAIQKEKIII